MNGQKILITGGSGFIGTHFINSIQNKNIEVINVDIALPKNRQHELFWSNCNILDLDKLTKIFSQFQPTHVLHLAARATTVGKSLDDFVDNTVGTENVLIAIKGTPCVSHAVIASTQHVRKPGSGLAINDIDFAPHGIYGESKVITEKLTRQANLNCTWTIIRPTTVWGPLHPYLPNGLWRYMKKGWYFHPKNDPVIRGYGYVKNVVWQIEQILNAPADLVNGKVFYIGEETIKQIEWINAFSNALANRDVRTIPKEWIHLLAYIGDILKSMGLHFPMDGDRYFNLTTTNPVPMGPIIEAFGRPPYSIEKGIQETVDWLNSQTDQSLQGG